MQYNGNVGFILDNSAWDAQAYSVTGNQVDKPAYANARATVIFGGPLRIPKLLSGRRGTFSLNYQLTRSRNGTTQVGTMPTALERSGDFSQSFTTAPVVIYDPLTGNPFPGNAGFVKLLPAAQFREPQPQLLGADYYCGQFGQHQYAIESDSEHQEPDLGRPWLSGHRQYHAQPFRFPRRSHLARH
jgi:hypothetical protein